MGCLGLEIVIVATRLCLGAESAPETSVIVRCPPLVEYSKDDQAAAARDIERLGRPSAASKMVSDYGRLRKQCRVVEQR